MALVALAIVGIIAMAGLSIDIGTLYQASAEAQRAADAAALAAARTISISGLTGDPTNGATDGIWADVCGGTGSPANVAAITAAQQNTVGGTAVPTASIMVTYSAGNAGGPGAASCSGAGPGFGVNPEVTVQLTQTGLPAYFSRIWGRTGSSVSATATAEAFNPSNSNVYSSGGNLIPVQPRCVKPWIVANKDPGNPKGCSPSGTACNTLVTLPGGSITTAGILINNGGVGAVGESFNLIADCNLTGAGNCNPLLNTPPGANAVSAPVMPNLQYLPGLVQSPAVAVPSCVTQGPPYYQAAIAGCDQSTVYQCGVLASTANPPNYVDLTENPNGVGGDTATAAACLTHEVAGAGADSLNVSVYPYQIDAGGNNPLVGGTVGTNSVITSSNSIVTLPIYDDTQPLAINGSGQAPVTIVGFLQVFIQNVSTGDGSLAVTVMNVAGCGNTVPAGITAYVTGTSPVPVRLITPPAP
jgi:Flp pilus assembly protein TadG